VRIAVVNGPNLNLLGQREPEIYGRATLADIEAMARVVAGELGAEVEFFQANGEGELIDYVQSAADRVAGFIVNAGGYSHTSVALLDALAGVGRPYVEVHLSNLSARESFRQRSLLSARARGVVMGFGAEGYSLAIRGLVRVLGESRTAGRES
jgi:3-dehydroquinate dehydratase-2